MGRGLSAQQLACLAPGLPLHWGLRSPRGSCPLASRVPSWAAPPLHPSTAATYNVHEREQVLLHVLLPMELDHRVVHAQQDLDVVVTVRRMPSRPAPRAVHSLLQDTQGTAEAIQAARGGP